MNRGADPLDCSMLCVVVVGACGHGLTITRALARAGVRVLVLEENLTLPGVHSRYGELHFAKAIHGTGLIEALLNLHANAGLNGQKPVLLLTNDRMVRDVGQNWSHLEGRFLLHWSECRADLLPLLDKSSIEAQCAKQGIAYPVTKLIKLECDIDTLEGEVGWPLIIKPTKPLAGFKTYLPANANELRAFAERHRADLPFLAQAWIPGDDRSIQFGALFLNDGKILGHFEGRKIRSRPMGHTTIAEALPDGEVYAYATKFFDGMRLSGPVSLEVKRDPQGRLWVIEPTVGRTDFWVGLCIENGFNLPLLECLHQTRRPAICPPTGGKRVIWFNEERDPLGRLWFAFSRQRIGKRRAVYLYACVDDARPFLMFLRVFCVSIARRALAKLRKLAVYSRPASAR